MAYSIGRRVIILFAIMLCLLAAHYFYRICNSEYQLYKAEQLLSKNSADIGLSAIDSTILQLKQAPATAVSSARKYRLLARLYRLQASKSVWRTRIRGSYSDALYHNYNAINQNPYNLQAWILNLDLQQALSVELEQQQWSLANVLSLGKWNLEAMRFGGFYCVLYWHKLSDSIQDQCRITLDNVQADTTYNRHFLNSLRTIGDYEAILSQARKPKGE